jgi:hypothetical protein
VATSAISPAIGMSGLEGVDELLSFHMSEKQVTRSLHRISMRVSGRKRSLYLFKTAEAPEAVAVRQTA